jgi:hypothetical protein
MTFTENFAFLSIYDVKLAQLAARNLANVHQYLLYTEASRQHTRDVIRD